MRLSFRLIMAIVGYIVLTVVAIIYLMPFIRSITASFMTWEQAQRMPPEWIPDPFTTRPFEQILGLKYFPVWLINSVIISASIVTAQTILASMAGFAFARVKFPGREMLFSLLLATMMMPGIVTLMPTYALFSKVGLIDNLLGIIIPGLCGASSIFLMRQYYLSMPQDLFDAARVDGCTFLKIFRHIAFPLARPALGALAIYQFLGSWNSFLGPLAILKSIEKFTLPVGLLFAFNRAWYVEYSPIIAGSTLAAAPTIIIFIIFNKYLIKGIQLTAGKR